MPPLSLVPPRSKNFTSSAGIQTPPAAPLSRRARGRPTMAPAPKRLSRAIRSGEGPQGTLRFCHGSADAPPSRAARPHPRRRATGPSRAPRRSGAERSDYERFKRNNFYVPSSSWNYRGCWHQACPRLDPRHALCTWPMRQPDPKGPGKRNPLRFLARCALENFRNCCNP